MEDKQINDSDLSSQRLERLAKIKELQKLGINPYPAKALRTHYAQELIDNFKKLQGREVTISGRLISKREHGKLMFGDLYDQSGKIQLYIRSDIINATSTKDQILGFEELKLIDVGDIVEVSGELTTTKRGEISVLVKNFKILTKSIRPLPLNWDGLKDKETLLRRRYLDLITNNETRELFARKAKFWQVTREFLQQKGFIEVEVPVLEHFTGGADARPFETYHNDLGEKLYLRISTELPQKRLIVGGFEKVYTFGPNFRNEGISDEHLQEYYQIEWYWAYADYKDTMELVKDLFIYIAKQVYGKTKFTTRGHTFDLADKWQEIDYVKVIKEKFNIDIFKSSEKEMLAVIKKEGIQLSGEINRNRLIDNLWKAIRKSISGPAFLINEPKFMSPLAKSKIDDPEITERIHVIIAGSELGNGYSELNDPQDQLARFVEQQKARDAGDEESQMMDIDFVEALEYGMPPTSGWGHSERLFWFLEDKSAREATIFPLLKFGLEQTTKEIYKDIAKYISPKSKIKKQKQ